MAVDIVSLEGKLHMLTHRTFPPADSSCIGVTEGVLSNARHTF